MGDGRYCSNCSSSLQPDRSKVKLLIEQGLISIGYVGPFGSSEARELSQGTIAGTLPSWIPPQVFLSINEAFLKWNVCGSSALFFDQSNLKKLKIAIVLDSSKLGQAEILGFVQDLLRCLRPHKSNFFKEHSLKNLLIGLYVLTDDANYRGISRAGCLRSSARNRKESSEEVLCTTISMRDKRVYPKSIWDLNPEIHHMLQLVIAQFHMDETLRRREEHNQSIWRSLLHVTVHHPTKELRKFAWTYLSLLTKPMHYATVIDQGRLSLKTALSYLFFVLLIISFIDKASGIKSFPSLFESVPLISEITFFLVVLSILLAWSLFIFIPNRIVGGKGSFKKTFLTTVIITVVTTPFVAILKILVFSVDPKSTDSPWISQFIYFCFGSYYIGPINKVIHKLTKRQEIWGWAVTSVLMTMLILFWVAAEIFLAPSTSEGDKAYREGNYQVAMVVYQKAADQGQAYAQYKLGVLYSNGLGVAQDHVAARAWYEKAAKQGNAAAQDNLGVLYHNGQGGLQDDVYARYLFREAATQGYAGAQNNLGLLYLKGLGGPQDNAYARALFRKAAEQGYATAQYNLGRLYENGQGGAQDHSEARVWYSKAADQGHVDAKARLAAVNPNGNEKY